MEVCAPISRDVCPDIDACHEQILACLPRGRAWAVEPGSVRWRFFRVVATLVAYANARICAFADEMFCDSAAELLPEWLRTYGLPDPCDPYPDLCAKVSAQGGQSCAYLKAVALRRGWDIDCAPLAGLEADCGEAECGEAAESGLTAGMLGIRVHAATSPALGAITGTNVEAGALEASEPITCPNDLSGLICLMDRIAPAHKQIVYSID